MNGNTTNLGTQPSSKMELTTVGTEELKAALNYLNSNMPPVVHNLQPRMKVWVFHNGKLINTAVVRVDSSCYLDEENQLVDTTKIFIEGSKQPKSQWFKTRDDARNWYFENKFEG